MLMEGIDQIDLIYEGIATGERRFPY